jgi:hypothetical protein
MISEADYAAIAARLAGPVAHVKAVSQVESNGQTFWTIGGKPVPPVRLEAHWFGKLTRYRFNSSHPEISCVDWTPELAATTWAGAWQQLEEARALDRDAADQATSWGVFQVMGFNWRRLSYAGVQGLVAAMYSETGQLEAFARFIEADPALKADLAIGAWLDFERRYNGGGFNGQYAARIEAAVAHFSEHPQAAPRLLKQGDGGADVAVLWQALGLPPATTFTPELADDVRAFQGGHGLVADGIVGPMTRRALGL